MIEMSALAAQKASMNGTIAFVETPAFLENVREPSVGEREFIEKHRVRLPKAHQRDAKPPPTRFQAIAKSCLF